jgi:hypothetical protein
LSGRIALEQQRSDDAARLLASAARRVEPLDPELARETHLEALGGAMVGDLEVPGGARVVAEAARSGPAPPRAADVLLDALATWLTDGHAAAAPALARGLELVLASDVTNEDVGRSLSLVSNRASAIVALELWDVEAFHLLASRRVQLARDTGALVHLRFALSFLARSQLLAGEVTAATSTIDEAQLIAEASGKLPLVNAPMILAAWRGQEERASELIEATAEEAAARRWTSNAYARSVLYSGLGRHDAARATPPGKRSNTIWSDTDPSWCPERACRGGIQDRRRGAARVRPGVALRAHPCGPLGVGARNPSPCGRAAERGRRRRAPVPRLDRAPLR